MTSSGSDKDAHLRLLLDEMHAPVVARVLRERGHDVTAVVDSPELRAMTDDQLYRWAAEHGRRIVTENIKDFRRILARAEESDSECAGLLFTSSRSFPRSRRNPGPLIEALHTWLREEDRPRPNEDWLRPAPGFPQQDP
jgi:nucleoside-diphosphate-sugar epimerase